MNDIIVPVNLEACISSSLDFIFSGSTGAIYSLGLVLEGSINQFLIPSDRLRQFGSLLRKSSEVFGLFLEPLRIPGQLSEKL